MALALALGADPLAVPRRQPVAGAAASLVYRVFDAGGPVPPQPGVSRRAAFASEFPDALLLGFARRGRALARDFRWTGSHRYAIVHLGGRDREDLRQQAEDASTLLGWPAPYRDHAPLPGCAPARSEFAAHGAAAAEASGA
jgi:hypothetical protein